MEQAKPVLVVVSLIMAGVLLWQMWMLANPETRPVVQANAVSPFPTDGPTGTADTRIDQILSASLTQQPSPTRTPKATNTPRPTQTPVPQWGTEDCKAGMLCTQWTPVPTVTHYPTETTIPEPGPCGTVAPTGSPQYCWMGDGD
jgi:hypothetical protein